MTTPNPCWPTGLGVPQAEMGTNDDATWNSKCACGQVTCESGTYDEAAAALQAHRGPAPSPA